MSSNFVVGITLKANGKGFVGEVKAARDAVKGISADAGKASDASKQFGAASEAAARRAGESFGRARAGVQSISEQLNRLQNLALSFVGFRQFARFAQSFIDTTVALDGFNAKMAIASGSAASVAAEYEYMRQLSNRLGTEVRSTADAYASFAAAARGTALEGAKAREVFAGVATASARMSLSVDAQQGVFLALSQMMSKGVVSAEEFRQQLGERLPIAATAGAAALGVTSAEFVELLNSGKLVSEEFLPKFAAALEKMAGDGGAVDNLQASLNRLSNKFTEFKQGFDVAPIKSAIDGLTDNFDALVAAAGKLLLAGGLVAGGYALGAAIGAIGTAAAAAAVSVATLNANVMLFLGGAALSRLEALGAAGKGGLLGMALWGGYEIGEFLNRNTQIQKSVQAVLDPVFRFFDHSEVTMLSKLEEKLAELKSGEPIRGAWGLGQLISPQERDRMIADTERQIAELRKSLGLAPGAAAAAAAPAAAPAVAAAGQISKAWADAYQTQAQKKASAIAELDALYVKEASNYKLSQEQQMMLARDYAAKRAEIDRLFSKPAGKTGKKEFDPEGDFWAAVDAARIKNAKKASKESADAWDESARAIDKARTASAEHLKQIEFETSLLGLSTLEAQKRTEARRIDLALEKELLALRGSDKLKADPAALKAAEDATRQAAETTRTSAIAEIEARDQVARSWAFGAREAIRKYDEQVKNSAAQAEALYSKAFKGAEDAVTQFAMTGKLNIRDFAQTVIEEFYRIQVARPMVSAGADLLGGLFGAIGGAMFGTPAGASASTVASFGPAPVEAGMTDYLALAGMRASGGPVAANSLYRVNERGPELLNYGGEDYLMMGGRGGYVTPVSAPTSAAPGGNVTVNIINQSGAQVRTQERADGNGGLSLDVILEQIEGDIARNVSRGSGALNGALTRTFGLNRVAGAY